MAASEVYSSLYSATNVGIPLYNRPFDNPSGASTDAVAMTIATTSLDDIGDFVHLIPIPVGKTITALWFNSADFDSATSLNADLVLRTKDKTGAATDTVLFAGGTGFQAAISTDRFVTVPSVVVPASALGYGSIGWKVNAAAGTAASGVINVGVLWR